MKKKEFRLLIREIVREEVDLALNRLMKVKNKSVKTKTVQKKTPVVEHTYSNNNVLNDILKQTAATEEWHETQDPAQAALSMNSILQESYSGLMGEDTVQHSGEEMIESMGINPDAVPEYITKALSKDYTKKLDNMKKAAEKTRPK